MDIMVTEYVLLIIPKIFFLYLKSRMINSFLSADVCQIFQYFSFLPSSWKQMCN